MDAKKRQRIGLSIAAACAVAAVVAFAPWPQQPHTDIGGMLSLSAIIAFLAGGRGEEKSKPS